MKRLLILSGKGGTGKTTTAAAFIRFANGTAVADCDVDAPNLHLILKPSGSPSVSDFIGGDKAIIDPSLCVDCGICREHCAFDAIEERNGICQINEYACEGCGVCAHLCPQDAVRLMADTAGQKELYLDGGAFSTAALKMGRGNSGKLVTEVKMDLLHHALKTDLAIFDGSPGIGCPVMASISGMDLVLVVAEPSLSGISDLKRLVKTAASLSAKLAVCVNKWDISPENTQTIIDFCRDETIPFVGTIPYDPNVSDAINKGLSIADMECPAHNALKTIFDQTIKLLEIHF